MRTPPITATPETLVTEAVQRMLQARRKICPWWTRTGEWVRPIGSTCLRP
jgi:hypothetical protein